MPVPAPKKVVVVPPEHQANVAPEELHYASAHPGYVTVPRLTWNEEAVAKFEGRPITSHESVQQPSHEEPVQQTHIKVI